MKLQLEIENQERFAKEEGGGRGMRQKIRDKSKDQTHEIICTYSQNVLLA